MASLHLLRSKLSFSVKHVIPASPERWTHMLYAALLFQVKHGIPASPEIWTNLFWEAWHPHMKRELIYKRGISASISMWTELLYEVWHPCICFNINWTDMASQHLHKSELIFSMKHGTSSIPVEVSSSALRSMASQHLLWCELSFSMKPYYSCWYWADIWNMTSGHLLQCEPNSYGTPASPEM